MKVRGENNLLGTKNIRRTNCLALSFILHITMLAVFSYFMKDTPIYSNHYKPQHSVSISFSKKKFDKESNQASFPVKKQAPIKLVTTDKAKNNNKNHQGLQSQKSSQNSIVPSQNLPTNLVSEQNTKNNSYGTRSKPFLLNAQDIKVPYPEQARIKRIEGTVKIKLTVAQSGKVIKADIISGPAYGLRQAALIVARKLFFLPATDDLGRAQVAQIEHEVIFKLTQSS
ncbi:MAG: TonB family protein [Myxococcales bacterium]|nr:TonB family protein [Myxococcales bacterium]USN49947.1 MAG: TonB family protein [Myxococcales bacterium]